MYLIWSLHLPVCNHSPITAATYSRAWPPLTQLGLPSHSRPLSYEPPPHAFWAPIHHSDHPAGRPLTCLDAHLPCWAFTLNEHSPHAIWTLTFQVGLHTHAGMPSPWCFYHLGWPDNLRRPHLCVEACVLCPLRVWRDGEEERWKVFLWGKKKDEDACYPFNTIL